MTLLDDLHQALRAVLRTQSTTTLGVVSTLAVVLAGVTSVFTVVDGVLLRPSAYRDEGAVMAVGLVGPVRGHTRCPFPLVEDFAGSLRSVDGVATLRFERFVLRDREWQGFNGAFTSTNLFDVLQPTPLLGRGFVQGDDAEGVWPGVLSESAWRRRFGADARILGREILLRPREGQSSVRCIVVGVTRAVVPSELGGDVEVFVPEPQLDPSRRMWQWAPFHVVARLRAGRSAAELRAETEALVEGRRAELARSRISGVSVDPLVAAQTAAWRERLVTLMAAAVMVLALACANIATLAVTAARRRQHEFLTRLALGATRGRLVRQLLLESLLVALAGGLLAIVLTRLTLGLLLALVPAEVPRASAIALDWRVFGFALTVAAACGLLCGLAPALVYSRADYSGSSGRTGGRTRRHIWLTEAIVAAQLAVSLGLTAAAALAVASEWRLATAPIGFEPDGVLALPLYQGQSCGSDLACAHTLQLSLDLAKRVPGVTQAAVTDALPPTPYGAVMLETPDGGTLTPLVRAVSPSYFDTLRIPLLVGRLPRQQERVAGLAVVNAAFARRWFGRIDVVGQRLDYGNDTLRIVGVAADAREWALRKPAGPTLYRLVGPGYTVPRFWQYVLVRTWRRSDPLSTAVRAELQRLTPEVPVLMEWLADRLVIERGATRFYARVLAGFSVFTVLVAVVGIAALVRNTLSSRWRELAIRAAVGATAATLRRTLLRRIGFMYGGGLLLGGWLGWLAGPLVRSALYGVEPRDPITLAVAALLVTSAAAGAALGPLRRLDADALLQVLRRE